MDKDSSKQISVIAHLARFGGAFMLFLGFMFDLWSGVLTFSQIGQNPLSLTLYMFGGSIMFGGVFLELIVHFLEGELVV